MGRKWKPPNYSSIKKWHNNQLIHGQWRSPARWRRPDRDEYIQFRFILDGSSVATGTHEILTRTKGRCSCILFSNKFNLIDQIKFTRMIKSKLKTNYYFCCRWTAMLTAYYLIIRGQNVIKRRRKKTRNCYTLWSCERVLRTSSLQIAGDESKQTRINPEHAQK